MGMVRNMLCGSLPARGEPSRCCTAQLRFIRRRTEPWLVANNLGFSGAIRPSPPSTGLGNLGRRELAVLPAKFDKPLYPVLCVDAVALSRAIDQDPCESKN